MALLTLLLTVVSATNPGLKLSQDAASFSVYAQSLLQANLLPISFADMANISYQSKLGELRTMDVNVTNFQVSNVDLSASTTTVSLSPPDGINVAADNLTGSLTFAYSIQGKGMSLKGTGKGLLTSSHLIINSTVGVSDGLPTLAISVPEMVISSVSLRLTPIPVQLLTDMQAHISAALTSYLMANATALYQAVSNKVLQRDTLRWLPVNSLMRMDASWTQAPTIVSNATSHYIVFYLNGTILPTSKDVPQIAISAPVAMPDRLPAAPNQGSIHFFISQYVLESYFWTYFQYQNVQVTQSALPPSFPVMLSTASGYFPEIATKFGTNLPVTVNFTLADQPLIAIDQKYGLRTSLDMNVYLSVSTESGVTTPVSFSVSLLYYSGLYISDSQFQGFPLTPILSIGWVNSQIGKIDDFNLAMFARDFFAAAAKSTYSALLFPSFPMRVPKGATGARFTRMDGYIAVDLQPGA